MISEGGPKNYRKISHPQMTQRGHGRNQLWSSNEAK
jgi:hypothetical protein